MLYLPIQVERNHKPQEALSRKTRDESVPFRSASQGDVFEVSQRKDTFSRCIFNILSISGKMAIIKSEGQDVQVERLSVEFQQLNNGTWGCNYCNQTTQKKSTIVVHIDTKHLHVRKFQCFHCQHEATTKGNLKTHCVKKHAMHPRHFDQKAKENNM